MNNEINDVIREFELSNAIMHGHFILSSGLHSPTFLQKMLVFQHPDKTEKLCKLLARKLGEEFGAIDVVISIATGGIIPGYETARWLGARSIFFEKENGELKLRRGFTISDLAKVVIIEDIITTGSSVNRCIEILQKEYNKNIIGVGCLIDRSDKGKDMFTVPLISLATYKIPMYNDFDLPSELANIIPIKPGS